MVTFLETIWLVLLDLAPWLLVGALVAGAMHVLLPANYFARQLSGRLGLLKSVVLGVPLPLCSCAVIPVGLSLKQSGASNGATLAFLISTPQTGVDSVLVSAALLGWPFALFKVASATLMGLVGGWWTDRAPQISSLRIVTPGNNPPAAPAHRILALLTHSVDLLRSIWRWLVLGIVVSAAITTWVPPDLFTNLAGGYLLSAMLVTLVIALPLYVCATASVPIAAALVASGLPAGAALVFLMAGPATNMATIGAVYRTLGSRALGIYLSTVILGSIGGGWLFSAVITAAPTTLAHAHDSHSLLSIASAALLATLLARFAFQELMHQ